MSRYNTYRHNKVYQAILATTLGTTIMSAHAVNLGQANISSAQHEPLSATINVSDINADNFSATVGNASMYQQMGLSKDAEIQVQFVPTSDTTGQLVLTSNQPISAPFTDVVLSLTNDGEQTIKPQTLLMPLPATNNISTSTSATPVVTANPNQNLPVVTESLQVPSVSGSSNPLKVQNSAPPPLFSDDSASTDNVSLAPLITHSEEHVLSQVTPEGSNVQLDVLTKEVTQRVYPAGSAPVPTQVPFAHTQNPDADLSASQSDSPEADAETTVETQSSDAAIYVVQNGDNLWSIANEIAKANNIGINEVMKAIHAQNPDAFNHGKASQLKANVSLSIPSYEVIPSQKAIQDALAARRTHRSTATAGTASNNVKASNNRGTGARTGSSNSRRTPARNTTANRALPAPQMTLVAPSQGTAATGAQTRSGTSSQGNGTNAALNSTLRNTRQQTANSARRVNNLNQELHSATRKLELQYDRLAELEARLKALREQ